MTLETQAEFARRINRNRSHVTRLKAAGRLVMREGKVAVDESLKRIEETEALDSPLARDQANRERLARERYEQNEADKRSIAELATVAQRKQAAQAEKIEHEAAIAKIERERLEGSLVPVENVKKVASDISALIRGALENMSDRYAPELVAATEVSQAQAIIDEAVELVLGELSRRIETMGEALRE